MTRENKLALVVGFGLILLVGILISDHFSTARRTQAAEVGPIIDPLSEADAANPELIALRTSASEVEPGAAAPEAAGDGAADTESAGAPPAVDPLATPLPGFIPVPAPGERFHSVARGETLSSISAQHYGDRSLAAKLAAYNRIEDPDNVPAGMSIRIPAILDGRPSAAAAALHALQLPVRNSGADRPALAKAAPGRGADGVRTYTVRKSETLSQIALELLGSSRRWEAILELNRDLLDDPKDLQEGMTLKIPRT
jgi:nucleoid-associated protein YgaU